MEKLMAWNESGNNGNGNDPWGGGRKGGNQGPPDIDEVIRDLTKKFNKLFGGSGGGSSSTGSSSGGGGLSAGLIAGLFVVLIVVWAFGGIRVVDEAERGVVLRFGEVLDQTLQPGLRWNPPLIDEVTLVNVSELNAKTYENRGMLTTIKNIIDMQDPELSLDNASESAIRHVVGGNYMDQILTTGRDRIADDVQDRLQDYMNIYNTGISVSQVNVVDAQPPDAVRPAFDDVIATEVTRQRLYIDSIEDVMTASSKIMVDVEGGNNMLFLPLDKIMEQSTSTSVLGNSNSSSDLRDLADKLAPYLPAPNNTNSVDRSRLPTSGRGIR